MKTLAKAKPNKKYRWYQNICDIILEARSSGTKVFFYSREPKKEVRICESIIKDFFREDRQLKDRPFLRKENPVFYGILFRNRNKYRESFHELQSVLNEQG
jgi:hypothetical protein